MSCSLCASDFHAQSIYYTTKYNVTIYGSLCEKCMAYCDKCKTFYAKDGDCNCHNFSETEMIDKIKLFVSEYDNSAYLDGDQLQLIIKLLAPTYITKRNGGANTEAFIFDKTVLLVSNDQAKAAMAQYKMFGIELIFDAEDRFSLYSVPKMRDGEGCTFLNGLRNLNSAFMLKNVYTREDLLEELYNAMKFYREKNTDAYLFVCDMITITENVYTPYASIDMRTDNIRYSDKEQRFIPYDAIYFLDYVYCEKCDNELYEGDAVFHNRKAYCDTCLRFCDSCGEVIDSDESEEFCSKCYEDQFFTCEMCGDTTHIDESNTIGYDSTLICHNCDVELNSGEINNTACKFFFMKNNSQAENNVTSVTFVGVDFTQCDISSTFFDDCTFIECQFYNTNNPLFGIVFKQCSFDKCYFDGISILNTFFDSCDFADTTFDTVNIIDSRFQGCTYFNIAIVNITTKNSLLDDSFYPE